MMVLHFVYSKENEEIITRLQNCSSNEFTKDIFLQYENSDGTLKTMNRINRWTSDSTVKEYIR